MNSRYGIPKRIIEIVFYKPGDMNTEYKSFIFTDEEILKLLSYIDDRLEVFIKSNNVAAIKQINIRECNKDDFLFMGYQYD